MSRRALWSIVAWLALLLLLLAPALAVAATSEPVCDATALVRTLELGDNKSVELAGVHPYNAVLLQVGGEASPQSWTIDGKSVKPTNPIEYCYIPETAGTKSIMLTMSSSNEGYEFKLPVTSYTRIALTQVKPHAGSDGNESVVLHNSNNFSVALKNWQLKNAATRTTLPISITIPSESDVTITSKGKLVDGGATYNLMNESGEVLDSVTYPAAPTGHVFIRSGSGWIDRDAASSTVSSQPPPGGSSASDDAAQEDTHVTIRGTVTHPSGDTFDMTSSEGKAVHVVIHASFDGVKPRLHQGDAIQVSGIWKTSRNGLYVSVRAGDKVELVTTAVKAASGSKSGSESSDSSSVTTLSEVLPIPPGGATDSPTSMATASTAPAASRNASLNSAHLVTNPWLRALFIGMIALGAALATPSKVWGAAKRML